MTTIALAFGIVQVGGLLLLLAALRAGARAEAAPEPTSASGSTPRSPGRLEMQLLA